MAQKFSTGLRNKILSAVPALGGATIGPVDTIAAVNGSPDSFTDTGSGFVTAGFGVGDIVIVSGFATAVNNGVFTLSSVAAGTIEVVETAVVNESAGVNVKIQCIKGGSVKDIFKDGILRIYSGAQPADADAAVTGTLLLEITISSGAWTAGAPANGLEFGSAAAGVLAKNSDAWSGVGLATGTAGWFRFFANGTDAGGLSTTLPRIDGSCGTSGAQLIMSNTSIVLSATTTIDSFTITLPA